MSEATQSAKPETSERLPTDPGSKANLNRNSSKKELGSKPMSRDTVPSMMTADNATKSKKQLSQVASRAGLSANNEVSHEIHRLESKIDALESKGSVLEESIVYKTSERIRNQMNYEARISQMESSMAMITTTVTASVLEKVSELLTSNINDLLPGFGNMEKKITSFEKLMKESTEAVQTSETKTQATEMAVENLKTEFEYVKARFSPQFVQRIEKTLQQLSTVSYDLEVVKMTTQHAAMKKDLDQVEQKFGGYVPSGKFNELLRQVEKFVHRDEMIKLQHETKHLTKTLSKFAETSNVNEKFNSLTKEMYDQLKPKLDKSVFDRKTDSLAADIAKGNKQIIRSVESMKETQLIQQKRSNDNNRLINEFRIDLDKKLSQQEGVKIWSNFSRFAVYDDLKDLYSRCLPAISGFEDKLLEQKAENERLEEVIRRFDEIICDKAGKQQIKDVYEHLNEKYIQKNEFTGFVATTMQSVDAIEVKAKKLDELVKFQSRQLGKEMFSAVRRALAQQNAKEKDSPMDMKELTGQIRELMSHKADKNSMEDIQTGKANKMDTEMCLRWVDLLHKMVNQIMILMTLKFKNDLEPVGGESVNTKKNKKVQLLHQSLVISKWIESFDSQNINDFYFQDGTKSDPAAIHKVQMQFRDAITEIESTALSPNLQVLNNHLQNTKGRLNLLQANQNPARQHDNQENMMIGSGLTDLYQTMGSMNRIRMNASLEKLSTGSPHASHGKLSPHRGKNPPMLSQRMTNRSVDPGAKTLNFLRGRNSTQVDAPSSLLGTSTFTNSGSRTAKKGRFTSQKGPIKSHQGFNSMTATKRKLDNFQEGTQSVPKVIVDEKDADIMDNTKSSFKETRMLASTIGPDSNDGFLKKDSEQSQTPPPESVAEASSMKELDSATKMKPNPGKNLKQLNLPDINAFYNQS